MPAAGEIHRLKKWRSPAGVLAGDHLVKHNGHFALSLSRLNLIYSRQPNFLATTLILTKLFEPVELAGVYEKTCKELWFEFVVPIL